MKIRTIAMSLAAAGMLAPLPVLADGSVSFSGFGTLGLTHSDSRELDFVGTIIQPKGAGKSKSTSAGIDTKAGVQAAGNIGKDLSATVQVVADRRGDNTYAPRYEWANLKYQVSKDLHVRAGRVVAPVFMVSDYRNVGYAQTMVRMPFDVYSQNPITHMDGGEIGYKTEFAGGTLGTHFVAGRIKEQPPQGEVRGNGQLLGFSFEKGSSTFRIGYLKDKVTVYGDGMAGVDTLNGYIRQIGQLVGRQQPLIPHTGIEMGLLNLGYAYDNGKWLMQTEFVRERGGWETVEDTDSWYLMGGYRLGKFTPYAAISELRSKEPIYNPAPAVAAISALQPLADAINLIDQNIKTTWEQKTISVGVRYDVMKNAALKLQYDRISKPGSPSAPNTGMFVMDGSNDPSATTLSPASMKKINVDLLTLTLDFVF